VQPAGRVDQHHINAPIDALLDSVESHGRRIRALARPNGLDADALAPGGQLLGGGSAEGVGCTEQHRLVLGDQHPSELAHGGGLAGAVDTDDEQDGGLALGMVELEGAVQIGVDQLDQLAAQQIPGLLGIRYPVDAQLLAERADQFTGRAHTQIGGDQRGLEVVPGLVVDAVARQ